MEKFGSIDQFKNVVKRVRDTAKHHGMPAPTLKFIGTVKLHGTNGGVRLDKDGSITFQSRERDLTIGDDNAGFCMWGEQNISTMQSVFDAVCKLYPMEYDSLVIFGEWCGGSIQKSVALNKLEKMFVVFNITYIKGDIRTELKPNEIKNVLYSNGIPLLTCVYDYKTYDIDIDFNAPQLSQNKLVELTIAVENECPVAKHFGVSGVGEGIVWWNPETDMKFKVKGEKHSASKVKTVKEIAASDIERMESIAEFVDSVITDNRLNQGLAKLGEMGLDIDIKNTGTFIKWVVTDALKEENDTIVESCFDIKEIAPKMSDIAKKFWFKTIQEIV